MKIKKFYRQQYSLQEVKDFIKFNDIKNYTIHRTSIYYELEYKK